MIEFFYKIILQSIFHFYMLVVSYREVIRLRIRRCLNVNNKCGNAKLEVVESKRVPNHVCVVVNGQMSNGDDSKLMIAGVIEKLSSIGVKNISVYVPNIVYNKLNQEAIEFLQNRTVNKNDSKVKILSPSTSGKGVLIQGLHNIANRVLSNDLNVDDIDESLICRAIFEETKFDEPDLVICIGLVESLGGYSPWHLKSTEILKLPTIESMNHANSIETLMIRYTKIEKRFGK